MLPLDVTFSRGDTYNARESKEIDEEYHINQLKMKRNLLKRSLAIWAVVLIMITTVATVTIATYMAYKQTVSVRIEPTHLDSAYSAANKAAGYWLLVTGFFE
ncbi:MAG: hypothetical protein HYZ16_08290 [Bacteroidetes bacterium]|nr:hypothetical protein [Bacteroidota bacterium]